MTFGRRPADPVSWRGWAVVVLLAGIARADPVADAADAVVAAVSAGDRAALEALAGKDAPDPWLVADELCARGEAAAAKAFAAAAPRPDTAKLPAYVESFVRRPDDDRRRRAVGAAVAALAKEDWTAALEALEGEAGEDDVLAARIFSGRASALGKLKRLDKAGPMWFAAAQCAAHIGWWARAQVAHRVALAVAANTLDHPLADRAIEGLATVLLARGDRDGLADVAGRVLAQARSMDGRDGLMYARRAVALFESLEDEQGVHDACRTTGGFQRELGETAAALASYERALAAAIELGSVTKQVDALRDLAWVLWATGRDEDALARLEPMLARVDNPRDEARVLDAIGVSHEHQGRYGKALSAYERALGLFREASDRGGIANTLNNLGNARGQLGDVAASIELYGQAIALAREAEDLSGEMVYSGNLALAHYRRGAYDEARPLQERILAYYTGENPDRPARAIALVNLGLTNAALGRMDDAVALQEKALALHRELENPRGVAVALGNLGELEGVRGNLDRALTLLEEGAQLAGEIGDRWHQTFNLVRLAHVLIAGGRLREALAVAHRGAEAATVMVGGLGDEAAAGSRDRWGGIYAIGAEAAARLHDAEELLFFLEGGRAGALVEALGGREALAAVTLPQDLRDLEHAARAAEAEAVARVAAARRQGERAALKDAKEALDGARAGVRAAVARIQREAKAAASIVYAQPVKLGALQARLAPGEAFVAYALLRSGAAALVVTSEEARIVDLGETREIRETCVALDAGNRDADPAAALARLRALVVDPLALPAETSRLLLAPHLELNLVPFAALTGTREVAYVPSGTTYDLLAADAPARGRGVLAIGDPAYAAERGLAPLPASRAEAKAIGDVVLLGKDASETRFLAEAARPKRWRAVHFAGHGLFDERQPAFSALAFAADDKSDGLLNTMEVLSAKVRADLAVLSACETARGRLYFGEGVVGFARAFMLAGTPRVITSLWKVDDEATRALMEKFYELWNPGDPSAGLPAATALKRAQEFVASHDRWKHPCFWSAWQLWGLPD